MHASSYLRIQVRLPLCPQTPIPKNSLNNTRPKPRQIGMSAIEININSDRAPHPTSSSVTVQLYREHPPAHRTDRNSSTTTAQHTDRDVSQMQAQPLRNDELPTFAVDVSRREALVCTIEDSEEFLPLDEVGHRDTPYTGVLSHV
jgi:hypothetical protein